MIRTVQIHSRVSQTVAAAAKSPQSCPTLCDPIDSSPPGFPVPGILQARTLEWVAISLSNTWKWKVKVKLLSRVWLLATPWTAAYQAPPSMGFSRQEYWSGVPLNEHLNVCSIMDVFTQLKARGFWISLSCTLWQSESSVLDKGDPEGLPLNKYHKFCCCLVAKLCPSLCDPINCSTPGFPVPQHLLEFAQIHVHWISDAVQPSHPLSPSTSSTFNFSHHQGLFQWFGSFHQVAKVLELQHQSFQWLFRVDFLQDWLV